MVNSQEVLNIRNTKQFQKGAIRIFHLQAEQNTVYKKYIDQLGVHPGEVRRIEQIPFLPIEFFKTQKVVAKLKGKIKRPKVFLSSGTTGMERSKHYVSDISIYEKSFRKGFELF